MPVIKAQSIPRRKIDVEEVLARFCYYYQQYTYSMARRLPFSRIVKMLKIAQKEQAKKYLEFVKIVAAPHSKKGAGVKKLLELYEEVINS